MNIPSTRYNSFFWCPVLSENANKTCTLWPIHVLGIHAIKNPGSMQMWTSLRLGEIHPSNIEIIIGSSPWICRFFVNWVKCGREQSWHTFSNGFYDILIRSQVRPPGARAPYGCGGCGGCTYGRRTKDQDQCSESFTKRLWVLSYVL